MSLRRRGRETGQFIPITAMVMFTAMVLLVAVVNIYKVAKAKLQVQNLADAVALNIASQMAGSINKVSDMNEYMNHMVAATPNGPAPTTPGEVPTCYGPSVNPSFPPISCAENPNKDTHLNMFLQKGDAASYAGLIQRINQTQQMFIDTFNNFIGAGTNSNASLFSLLMGAKGDIPDLNQPGTKVIVWNTLLPQGQIQTMKNQAIQKIEHAPSGALPAASLDTQNMQPLKFITHDIAVTYHTTIPILNTPGPDESQSLGELLAGHKPTTNSENVGWMELDPVNNPTINAAAPGANPKFRMGAGALVVRAVSVPFLGSIAVASSAQAFVVQGSGQMGDMQQDPMNPAAMRPVFKPTYWVKLVGAR